MIDFKPEYIAYKGEQIEMLPEGYMYDFCFWEDILFLLRYIDFKEKYLQQQSVLKILEVHEQE